MKTKSLSRVRLLATPWTAAHQAPPSMGFSRQEYWSGVPLPSLIVNYRETFKKKKKKEKKTEWSTRCECRCWNRCDLGMKVTLVLTLVYEGQHNWAPSLSTVSGLWRHHASWLLGLHTNCYFCLLCSLLPLHLTKTYPLGHFFKEVRSPFRTLCSAKYVLLSCLAEGVFQVRPHQHNIK